MKDIIQHPRMAWWLACFACALILLSLPLVSMSLIPNKEYTQEITIRTNGTTGDVVTAVENLKRNDLVISTHENPFYQNGVAKSLGMLVYLTLGFAFISALVSSFERRFRISLGTKTEIVRDPSTSSG